MPNLRLSLCIPTYNFGPFIGQTLDSILPQLPQDAEVVVLDGGSTDNTVEEVTQRARQYPQLIYHRQGFRGGIDRDIEKAVSLASAEYCWLFSADDIMRPGAIAQVLEAIATGDDIYICEHILSDFDLKPISTYPPFYRLRGPKLFDFKDAAERQNYFRLARTSEAFFSFLSGPIFRKKLWDDADVPESFRGTCWIVAGHLLGALQKEIRVKYLHAALLLKREGNDSFSQGSVVNRCKIGIENFQHVADTVFGRDSEEAFHIRRVLHRDVSLRSLLFAKRRTAEFPEKESSDILQRIVRLHYQDATPGNRLKYALFRLAHPALLTAAHRLKCSLRKNA